MFDRMLSRLLLPLFETGIKRRSIFQYWAELEASQWLPTAELEHRQLVSLRRLLDHASRHCPYYRDEWARRGLDPAAVRSLDDFRRWPIVDRDTIRQHRMQMRASLPGLRTFSKATGGSSGNPLHFDLDRDSHDRRVAACHRAYSWAGAAPGTRQLHLWGVPLGPRPWWRSAKDWLYHRLYRRLLLNAFDLSEQTLPRFVDQWNWWQPEVVVAYTSALYSLARMIDRRRLRVSRPASIVVGAEKLYPFQREFIEEVVGAPVYETYGCREVMLIGAECERREGLHVPIEHILVEIVDDRGQPTPAGQVGNVVLTDLFNFGMPFIRYANGDRAIAGFESCSCGRGLPLLRGVVGRRLDVLLTPDGRQVPGEFFPHLLKDFPSVQRFQVIQESLDRIELRICLDAPLTAGEQSLLDAEVRQVLGTGVSFEIRVVDAIPLTAAGKQQVVVQRCLHSPHDRHSRTGQDHFFADNADLARQGGNRSR